MAKSTVKSNTTSAQKNDFRAQDKKDTMTFLKWTIGITLVLLILIYILYTNAVG